MKIEFGTTALAWRKKPCQQSRSSKCETQIASRFAGSGSAERAIICRSRNAARHSPRRIPLEATNLSEAKLAAEEKRREAREGQLPARGRKPTFAEVADACFAIAATKEKTAHREGGCSSA